MDVDAELERARQAHLRRRWADAADAFVEIDAISPLDVDDLDRLAEALDLVGRGDDAIAVLQRVYVARVDAMEIGKALRNAFWLYRPGVQRELAQAGAWIARATRLTADGRTDRARVPAAAHAERQLRDGDYQSAFATAKAARLGVRCRDRDVVTVAVHLQGRARVGEGRISEDLGAARRGDAGHQRRRDLLARHRLDLLQDDPDLPVVSRRAPRPRVDRRAERVVRFPAQLARRVFGICRIHRSELLQLVGAWSPRRPTRPGSACRQLTLGYGLIVTGGAYYQLGDIHRLRGELADAEQAYQLADRYGSLVQPGVALLRLAQGDTIAAMATIRRALAEATTARCTAFRAAS